MYGLEPLFLGYDRSRPEFLPSLLSFIFAYVSAKKEPVSDFILAPCGYELESGGSLPL